jgi:hypothetical protein
MFDSTLDKVSSSNIAEDPKRIFKENLGSEYIDSYDKSQREKSAYTKAEIYDDEVMKKKKSEDYNLNNNYAQKNTPLEIKSIESESESDESKNIKDFKEKNSINFDSEDKIRRYSFKNKQSSLKKSSNFQEDNFLKRLSKRLSKSLGSINKIKPVQEKIPADLRLSEAKSLPRLSKIARSASSFFHFQNHDSELKTNYLILYRDYKQERVTKAFYLLFDMLRHFFLSMILVFLYEFPLEQIIIISFVNISILIYLIIVRPFTKTKDFILNLINETFMCSGCLACLAIAFMDHTYDQNHDKRFKAGWVIFFANTGLMFASSLVLLSEIILVFKEIFPKIYHSLKYKFKAISDKKRNNSVLPVE